MSERSSIGEKRLEYLDYANKAITAQDYGQALSSIDNFLSTIKENTPVSKELQDRFDEIEKEKMQSFIDALQTYAKETDWIKTERLKDAQIYLEIKAIKDKREACWNIGQRNGVFND